MESAIEARDLRVLQVTKEIRQQVSSSRQWASQRYGTPLEQAIKNRIKIAEFLLRHGVDVRLLPD